MLDPYVFELHPHWLSGMKLQGQFSIQQCSLRSRVGEVQNKAPVHEVLNMISFGDDDNVIPIIEFEQLGCNPT